MPKSRRSKVSAKKFVPYVKGFRPPTPKQRSEAVGKLLKTSSPEYDASANFFEAIPRCTSVDDWLVQYNEEGQTYEDFLFQTPWLSRRKLPCMKQDFNSSGTTLPEKYPEGKIYILPLGKFDSEASPQFDALIEYAQLFFRLPVKKLPAIKLEETERDTFWIDENKDDDGTDSHTEKLRLSSRHDAKSGRRQLKVHDILSKLRSYLPGDGLCLIALTMSDLFDAKPDLFVAGMAAGRNRVAVFSLLRYDPNLTFSQEFWYKIKHTKGYTDQVLLSVNVNHTFILINVILHVFYFSQSVSLSILLQERQRLILLRSCRLLVHETSHLLGIGHCIYYSCCMNGSGTNI